MKHSPMMLIGLGILGAMAYMFLAPKVLGAAKKVPAEGAGARGIRGPTEDMLVGVRGESDLYVGIPNNATGQMAVEDCDMSFAGVSFAESIPGMTYGFPLAGIV